MRVALYTRISKDEKVTRGMSLADQEARLRSYCESRNGEDPWSVVELYQDNGQSGKTLDRPAFQHLRDDAKAKRFGAVAIIKLDRLTRSVRDLGTLIEEFGKGKIELVSLSESIDTSSAAGRFVLNLLGSVAQWEREAISERTTSALRFRRDAGKAYSGETPWGFARVDTSQAKLLKPLERELAVVRRIYALRQDGLTLRAIATVLNTDRIRTKKGRKWAPEQIRYMLANELYQPFLGEHE